jgi:hypothetical protein
MHMVRHDDDGFQLKWPLRHDVSKAITQYADGPSIVEYGAPVRGDDGEEVQTVGVVDASVVGHGSSLNTWALLCRTPLSLCPAYDSPR